MAVGFLARSKPHCGAPGALLKKERIALPANDLIRPSSVFDHAFAMKT
jgi:hypothetical protein